LKLKLKLHNDNITDYFSYDFDYLKLNYPTST
jgi:hypothetical protein